MRFADDLAVWNRRLHFYVGLYFLFFLWLLAVTGLVINHPKWSFAEFWPQRKEVRLERPVQVREGSSPLAVAQDLMRQLGIPGEVEWTARQQRPGHFDFRVMRPGHMFEIKTDLEKGRAQVTGISLNAWGTLGALHRLNGVHPDDDLNSRDWLLTSLWTFSMDALCVGLIVMVASGVYVWYRSRQRRVAGLAALALGTAICAFFVFGLDRL